MWHLPRLSDYLRTPLRSLCSHIAWRSGHTKHIHCGENKKGRSSLPGHERRKGTTLTVIIQCRWFHWLAPFSAWRCIIQGNQLLLCLLWMKRRQPRVTVSIREAGDRDCRGCVFFNLHLFLSPRRQDQALLSSPSGKTGSNKKRKKSISKVRAGYTGALGVALRIQSKMYFWHVWSQPPPPLKNSYEITTATLKKAPSICRWLWIFHSGINPQFTRRLSDCVPTVLPLKNKCTKMSLFFFFATVFDLFLGSLEWLCRQIRDSFETSQRIKVKRRFRTGILCDKLTAFWDKSCLRTSISLCRKKKK